MYKRINGLLHNITISLKSIRPNETEIKIIAEKNWYISTRARTFSLHHPVTTMPTPNQPTELPPLLRNQSGNFVNEHTDIADETRDFPCIAVLIGNSKSAPPVFWSALVFPSYVPSNPVSKSFLLHDQLIQTGSQGIWLAQSRSVNPHTARVVPRLCLLNLFIA